MMSISKKNNSKPDQKISLGRKTDSVYKYSSRINFKEDLSLQIAKLMQEKKAKDELEAYIEKIRKISSQFKHKEKNLNYYRTVGEILSFLNNDNFRNIKPYSVFRRLVDEIPDVLLGIDTTKMQSHLMMMYKIGGLDKSILSKASWDQWYEIMKFKDAHKKQKLLKEILEECKYTGAGPSLRNKIKIILKKIDN